MKKFYERFSPEQIRELFLVVMIALVIVVFSTQVENYFNVSFINRLSTSVAIIAVLAVGQTLVFLTRNFDLSIGSIVGVTAYIVGQQLTRFPNMNPIVTVLLAIGLGILLGSINGLLVAYGRVPSIITTISTLAIYRSFLVEYSKAIPITTNNLPRWVVDLNKLSLLTIGGIELRVLFLIMLVIVIIFQLVLSYLRFGRRLYAIGSNPTAAKVAGFPDRKIIFLAFILSGALAGLAGFMYLVRFGNIMVLAGIGLEFASIAAVVVGGVSNNGGSGTVIGALLGAVMIDLLENSLYRTMAVSEFWRDAILGMLILSAVAIDHVFIGRLRKVWVRAGFLMQTEEEQQKSEVSSSAK
ncbi:MAG: ABC transporter permease [Anaerolineaceae bacterium]|nr:ABC transporter permease [Anaerolineaceae bacterium]